jgi:DNA-binding MarR family transcriptional regulator
LPHRVSRALDRLEEKGFLVRTQDAAERRRILLSLTEAGRQLYRDLFPALASSE